MLSVPLPVMGLPVTLMPVPAVAATEVTTPVTPLIDPPVIATALASCPAIVPTPVSVWLASQAAAPVALKELSDGVEWVTEIVMPRSAACTGW